MRFGNVTSGGIYSSKDESINQNSKNGVKQSKQNIFINNLQNISEWIPSSKNFKNDNNSNNMMKNGMQNIIPYQMKNFEKQQLEIYPFQIQQHRKIEQNNYVQSKLQSLVGGIDLHSQLKPTF
jgi:hypothetical protein